MQTVVSVAHKSCHQSLFGWVTLLLDHEGSFLKLLEKLFMVESIHHFRSDRCQAPWIGDTVTVNSSTV